LIYYICDVLVFFFSSRRRHTRFKCDWSSDVCSSDLAQGGPLPEDHLPDHAVERHRGHAREERGHHRAAGLDRPRRAARRGAGERSEERRVGKEWRSGGGPDELKKKDGAREAKADKLR